MILILLWSHLGDQHSFFFLITKVEYYLNLCVINIHINRANMQYDLFWRVYNLLRQYCVQQETEDSIIEFK